MFRSPFTLHQSIRQKQLVQLFLKAGHILSYNDILHIYLILAECSLLTMFNENGAVIPPSLVHGRFLYFTADNIDINDSTHGGKNTSHCTQMAVWQHVPNQSVDLEHLTVTKSRTLTVPECMDNLIPPAAI